MSSLYWVLPMPLLQVKVVEASVKALPALGEVISARVS